MSVVGPDASRSDPLLLGTAAGLVLHLLIARLAWWWAFLDQGPMANDGLVRWLVAIGVGAVALGSGALILARGPRPRRLAGGVVLGCLVALALEVLWLVWEIVRHSA